VTKAQICRSTHPLDQAHSPTPAASGQVVYVVCGWQGCPQRRVVRDGDWQAALARRQAAPDGRASPPGA
jgi:hypothetical protein